jgi:hypothetical protein
MDPKHDRLEEPGTADAYEGFVRLIADAMQDYRDNAVGADRVESATLDCAYPIAASIWATMSSASPMTSRAGPLRSSPASRT